MVSKFSLKFRKKDNTDITLSQSALYEAGIQYKLQRPDVFFREQKSKMSCMLLKCIKDLTETTTETLVTTVCGGRIVIC